MKFKHLILINNITERCGYLFTNMIIVIIHEEFYIRYNSDYTNIPVTLIFLDPDLYVTNNSIFKPSYL